MKLLRKLIYDLDLEVFISTSGSERIVSKQNIYQPHFIPLEDDYKILTLRRNNYMKLHTHADPYKSLFDNAVKTLVQNDHTDRSAGKRSSPVADCIFKLTTKVQDKILHDTNMSRNDMENAGSAMRALTHQFISMSDKSGSLDHVDSKEFHNLKLLYLKVIKFITGTSFFTFHDADHLYTSEPLELTEFLRKLYDNNPELCIIDCTMQEHGAYGEVEEMDENDAMSMAT